MGSGGSYSVGDDVVFPREKQGSSSGSSSSSSSNSSSSSSSSGNSSSSSSSSSSYISIMIIAIITRENDDYDYNGYSDEIVFPRENQSLQSAHLRPSTGAKGRAKSISHCIRDTDLLNVFGLSLTAIQTFTAI